MNEFVKNHIDMPNKSVDFLIRFLNQNNGTFSKRALDKELSQFTSVEVKAIEHKYDEIFYADTTTGL